MSAWTEKLTAAWRRPDNTTLTAAVRKTARTVAVSAMPLAAIGLVGCQSVSPQTVSVQESGLGVKAAATAPSERTLLIAETYARQGQDDRAAILFSQVLKAEPTNRRAVVGLNAIDPRAAAKLADAKVLRDVTGFRSTYELADLSQPRQKQGEGAAREANALPAVETIASTKEPTSSSVTEPVSSKMAPTAAPVQSQTIVQTAFFDPELPEPGAVAVPKLQREKQAVSNAVQAVVVQMVEDSAGATQGASIVPVSRVVVADTPSDTDGFFLAGDTANDAEGGLDLGSLLREELGEAIDPEQGIEVAAGSNERAASLPAIQPLDLPGEAGATIDQPLDSEPPEDVTWVIASDQADLAPVDAAGWAKSSSQRPATGRHYATVPELTALAVAETVSQPQLLMAKAACDSPSEAVRLAAAEAVLSHRPQDEQAWKTVDELLADGQSETRTLAALMLSSLPAATQNRSMPRLLDLLAHAESSAKSAAALAIGGLGDVATPAIPQLRELAAAGLGEVSEAATVSLDCLGVAL